MPRSAEGSAEGSAEAGIRSRFRAQVRQEAKDVALRQLAEGGPQAVSVNAVARELGVSGPALYRYFTNRDELLAHLVEDAYADLTGALAAALGHGDPESTVRAVAAAYRAWALEQPHRYRLLFTAPVVDFDPQAERLVTAAQPAMDVVFDAFTGFDPGTTSTRSRTLDRTLTRWVRDRDRPGMPPDVAWRAVTAWTLLHGFVSLEIEGNFASMGLDADALYRSQLDAVLA